MYSKAKGAYSLQTESQTRERDSATRTKSRLTWGLISSLMAQERWGNLPQREQPGNWRGEAGLFFNEAACLLPGLSKGGIGSIEQL